MEFKKSIYSSYYGWWKNIDKTIFFLIVFLLIIGLFFSLVSTSLIASDKLDTNDYSFFFKHLIFIILGLIVMFFLSSLDQTKLFKFSLIIFFISLIFLILVPFIGIEVKGSKRWIDFYLLPRFQPIELVKPFLIIFISLILSSQKKINIYVKYLLSFLITLCVASLLLVQPDFGQTLLVFFSWTVLIFTSGINVFFLTIFFMLIFSYFFIWFFLLQSLNILKIDCCLFLILKMVPTTFNLKKQSNQLQAVVSLVKELVKEF